MNSFVTRSHGRFSGAVSPGLKLGLFLSLLFSTSAAFGGEQINVAVCNIGRIPAPVIDHAEDEAAYVFGAMGVEIHWMGCGADLDPENARMHPDFIVRVRLGGRIGRSGPASLSSMGHAFIDEDGAGYVADVYYGAVQQLTSRYSVADDDRVLGYTMVHELGHLLIGAGHRPRGIMRAAWSEGELTDISRRHLSFNEAERAAILRTLRVRDYLAPRN